MIKKFCLVALTLATSHVFGQHVPTFEEVISLRNIVGLDISPDGKHVAYTVQSTDWNDNRNDIEIWLSKDSKKPFQLTFSKNSSTNPSFSPDGQWIAFVSDRGNKNQIYVTSTRWRRSICCYKRRRRHYRLRMASIRKLVHPYKA